MARAPHQCLCVFVQVAQPLGAQFLIRERQVLVGWWRLVSSDRKANSNLKQLKFWLFLLLKSRGCAFGGPVGSLVSSSSFHRPFAFLVGAEGAGAFAGLLPLQTQARGRLCVGVPEGGPRSPPRAQQVDTWMALLRPRASHLGLWGQLPSPEPLGFLQRETEALRKLGWMEGDGTTC